MKIHTQISKLLLLSYLLVAVIQPANSEYLRGSATDDSNLGRVEIPPQQPQTLQGSAWQAQPPTHIQMMNGGIFIPGGNPNDGAQVGRIVRITPISLASELAGLALKHRHRQLQSGADEQLYCCGFRTNTNHEVIYIDPSSDMVGKMQLGDQLLTVNNEDSIAFVYNKHNYANIPSIFKIGVLHRNGGHEFFLCRRMPVANLAPGVIQNMLSPN